MVEILTVKFLVESIAAGAIGHWVSRGLDRLSEPVSDAIKEGQSAEDIARVIDEVSDADAVNKMAASLKFGSIIHLPEVSGMLRHEEKSRLIADILRFAVSVAKEEQSDLLLRGSPVGPASLMMFTREAAKIEQNGVEVTIGGEGRILYFWCLDSDRADELFYRYKSDLLFYRERFNAPFDYLNQFLIYLQVTTDVDDSPFRVSHLNSASLHTLSKQEGPVKEGGEYVITRKKYGLFPYEEWKPYPALDYFDYGEWSSGLAKLLSDAFEVRSWKYLSDAESSNIRDWWESLPKFDS